MLVIEPVNASIDNLAMATLHINKLLLLITYYNHSSFVIITSVKQYKDSLWSDNVSYSYHTLLISQSHSLVKFGVFWTAS